MKKILFTLVAICSLGIISCEKSIEPIAPQDNDSKLVKMTFSASTPATRTAIGALSGTQYPVTWSEGDQIRVIAVDETGTRLENENEIFDIDAARVGSETASFTGTSVKGAAAYYAVYPASLNVTVSGVGGAATIALSGFASHDVAAVEGGFDPSRAVMFAAADANNSFTFMHGVSFFKITVSCPGVSSIEFRVPKEDNGIRIFGNPTFKLSDGTTSAYAGADKENNYVTLKPASGTLVQGGTYYIPFAAKSSSLSTYLQLTYDFGDDVKVRKKTTKVNGTFANGTVYDLGTPPFSAEPSLKLLTTTVINIPFEAASNLTIENAYKLFLCDDEDITVSYDDEGIITSASISNGTVTYSISANTEQKERTGYVYLQLGENDKLAISVTQLAYGETLNSVTYYWSFAQDVFESINENASLKLTSSDSESSDQSITWSFGGADLTFIAYKARYSSDTPGYHIQTGGAGSMTRNCFSFEAPSAGVFTVSLRGTGNSNSAGTLSVLVDGSTDGVSGDSFNHSASSKPTTFSFSIPAGTVVFYTSNKARIYSLGFTNED